MLQAAAFVGFALARELPALYAASLVFGFSYGAGSTLFPAAVADFFGREQAASLAGCSSRWPPRLVTERRFQRARPDPPRLCPAARFAIPRLTPPAALA